MNMVSLVLVAIVAFTYFGGQNVPKVLKDNKQMILGVFVGVLLHQFMGIGVEGWEPTNKTPEPGEIGSGTILTNWEDYAKKKPKPLKYCRDACRDCIAYATNNNRDPDGPCINGGPCDEEKQYGGYEGMVANNTGDGYLSNDCDFF